MEIGQSLAGKNVLVTGGTGFAGSHLVEALAESGANVFSTCISLYRNSYFTTQGLDTECSVGFVDITDFAALKDFLGRREIDFIFHLAAQPIVTTAYNDPVRTLNTNIMGTVNVLECARTLPRVKGTIVASSDKTYGKMTGAQYVESDRIDGDHPYDVSKSCVDLICKTYHNTYGLPIVVTRFGNIYGEGDLNLSRIVPSIMLAGARKQPIELRSDGSHIRDYLYVKDVVRGYLFLADIFDKVNGEAFNLGSDDTYTVLELIDEIRDAVGFSIEKKILNNHKNELLAQSLDYTKIKKLGFENKFCVSDVAPDVYEWYRDHCR